MADNETHTDRFGNRLFWQGVGWYASRQDGQHISTYLVPDGLAEDGASLDNRPETYRHGLGYAYWLKSPDDWLMVNT